MTDTALAERPRQQVMAPLKSLPTELRWMETPRDTLIQTLASSLYPGAKLESVGLVLDYCATAGLNVMLKPVHIVPMNVKKAGTNNYEWRDIVMPGINHYRTQASRTGVYIGKSEAEFGPMVQRSWGNVNLQVPEWCRITVKRLIGSHVAEFTATEYWDENYATAGRDKPWPNTMWHKRPRGQLAKCTEAQALRMAFPEFTGDATAEEMEGKVIDAEAIRDDSTVRPRGATRSLDHFAGTDPEPEPEAEGSVDPNTGEITAGGAAEGEGGAEGPAEPVEVPTMPDEALAAWTGKREWAAGWQWINEAMPKLDRSGCQQLADTHAALLWAVYDSDGKKKGPQSKAALKLSEDFGFTMLPRAVAAKVEAGSHG